MEREDTARVKTVVNLLKKTCMGILRESAKIVLKMPSSKLMMKIWATVRVEEEHVEREHVEKEHVEGEVPVEEEHVEGEDLDKRGYEISKKG